MMPDSALETDQQLAALLEVLIAEVRGLRSDLVRDRRPRRVLSRTDCAYLSKLLPVIAGAINEPFLTRDLFVSDSAALQFVLQGWTAIRIGRLFQRAEGHTIDGYVVERDGTELHATLWRVLQVPGSGLPAVPPEARR
jgi:hypothetical protein